MRLFFRDHIPLIIILGIQIVITSVVYAFNDGSALSTISYVFIVSLFLLLVFLVYQYVTKRGFYARLSNPESSMEPLFTSKSRRFTPIEHSLQDLLAEQFRLTQQELHQAENRMNRHVTFMNQWVHDMKTPLSVIHMTIQDEDEPIFDSIREETDRLTKGLETVLYMARLDSFEHDFYIEEVDLAQVLGQFVKQNKRLFIRSQVFPKIEIAENLTVISDEKWISFVFSQIINNAVKYSAGKSRSIEITASTEQEQTIVHVRDFGIGIPAHDVERVFEPYFTGDNGREYPASTGMGLYLVHEICLRLGHRITITSQQGEGTDVRIYFANTTEDDAYRRKE